jgi:hypothetical protein
LTARADQAREASYRYLLMLRFVLFNLIGFALLGAAHLQGLLEMVLIADQTYLSALIFLVFLGGLAICAHKIWQTSRELNYVRAFDPLSASRAAEYIAQLRGRSGDSRGILASSMRLKLTQRVAVVRRHGHRLRHRAVRGSAGPGVRRQGDHAHGLDPDLGHVDRALHHPGRLGAQRLADDQLPLAGRRHGQADHRVA